jgi:PPIC-type PPIASE domain
MALMHAQSQSVTQMKKVLDTTSNPLGYVKFVLKKKFRIDTVTIMSSSSFLGLADSLGYYGKTGKTYGPFKGNNILVKILAKLPNTFYHVSHILLDTAIFRKNFADSLSKTIIAKIQAGSSDFGSQARIYSADLQTALKDGDLGWFIQGALIPEIDKQMAKRKKGELFTVWSSSGLHIVKITDAPKKDNGFVLMLRVFL